MILVLEVLLSILFIYALVLLFVYIYQSRLFFTPKYYRNHENLSAIKAHLQDLLLSTEDNNQLEGVLYQPLKRSEKVLLYFGGIQQDSVGLVDKFAQYYPEMAFISYNYRGYGKSEGKPSQAVLFEDAMLVYDNLILEHNHKPEDIILMGYSLGSGVASFLASQRHVQEVLLMAPYDSVHALLKKRFPFSGIHWILKERFPSIDFVPHIDVPVHIYASSDDKVVNIKHAKMLKKHVANLAGFYEYANLGHNEILFNADVVEHIKDILHPSCPINLEKTADKKRKENNE